MTSSTQACVFSGVKIALMQDQHLVTILRDNKSTIPFPDTWDLPGGGRESLETPFECVQREVMEELGIAISQDMVVWEKAYQGVTNPEIYSIFMVAMISKDLVKAIHFGDEGQAYKLVPVKDFLADKKAVPQLQERLAAYLAEKSDQ
ncbi:NUDIX hydrolase [Streptococcus dysgalactiae]|uniref:NUDIX hydrolase n=1 Tax=Streptococcus dysgalactiae TaxID=1334 RepID=UPI0010CAB263|nr:NUDIX hydrolase [Streptococcus dysgalactiae]QZT27432.1 NUDIX hydrolase [Streptococcus dysgalactiae]VTS96645.1 7,8-dihydro-8-oxoguanine triphosphatase [Streptococcus dysgalactiae]